MLINTSLMFAFSSGMIVIAVTSPADYAPDIASVFMGVFGGLMVQLWTVEDRKPTRRVMMADIMASAFCGFTSKVMGVPTCLGIINKFLPEDSKLVFDATNHLGAIIVISGLAGMVGVGLLRKGLDKLNPAWMNGNGKQ